MPVHPNAWLTQAYGSQEVTLTPVTPCKYNCTEVSVVLQPSDVCKYKSLQQRLMLRCTTILINCVTSQYYGNVNNSS